MNVNTHSKFTFTPIAENVGTANDGVIKLDMGRRHPVYFDENGEAQYEVNEVVYQAVEMLDEYINFADYDTNKDGIVTSQELTLSFVFAGLEGSMTKDYAQTLWAHGSASLVTKEYDGVKVLGGETGMTMRMGELHPSSIGAGRVIATIGIVAHELGHVYRDLQDLYDTDYSSSGGVGTFGLMASGAGGYFISEYDEVGDSPALMIGYSQYMAGLMTPTIITETTYDVTVKAPDHSDYNSVMIKGARENEYFMIDNLQKVRERGGLWIDGWSEDTGGLLITRINENNSGNDDDDNRLVEVVEAQNLNMLQTGWADTTVLFKEGDVFSASSAGSSNYKDGTASGVTVSNIRVDKVNHIITFDVTIEKI